MIRHTPLTPDELRRRARRDLHCHTKYCRHAVGEMEDYVRSAIDRGLEEIGFLEHVERGIQYSRRTWLDDVEVDVYWNEAIMLKRQYARQIVVSAGIELGVNPAAVRELTEVAERHPWDRVALSYHFVWDETANIHLNISSAKDPNLRLLQARDPVALALEYYDVLARHIPVFRPFMICHLDVPRRNLPDVSDEPAVRAAIRRVLAAMRQAGAALEINTAGYVYTGQLYPAPGTLSEAIRMGLNLVFASDSHAPDRPGTDFDRALAEILPKLEDGR
ncbi:MAG: histidinol-phosphatase HisJ family protein [Acidobacteria bacterium]|nr:histidinol-phosphatase HisJ family protein [Acidobacteriota bacterium]